MSDGHGAALAEFHKATIEASSELFLFHCAISQTGEWNE